VWNLNAQFFTEDACFPELKSESDARIKKHVVVRIIAKIASKNIRFDSQLSGNTFVRPNS